MPNRRKIVIVLLLLCVIGVGIVLVFKSSFSTSTVLTNQQVSLCQNSLSLELLSNETRQISCQTEVNSWIDISLSSSGRNSTLGLTVSLLTTNGSGTTNNQTIYSESGKTFAALLPVSVNGSTLIQIANGDGGNTTVKGYVDVYRAIQTSVIVETPTHPFRPEGLVVIFGGALFLFIFGWDPRGLGTMILTPKTTPISKRPANSLLRNVWFLRAFSLVFGIMVSATLLTYSLIFYYSFKATGSALSYFPWAWNVLYTDPNAIRDLFAIGLVIAIVPLSLFIMTLFRYVLPALDSSLKRKEVALHDLEEERAA